MPRYFWIVLWLMSLLSPAAAQDSLLDRLNKELAPLSRLETLYVLKFAENKITDQLKAIATSPLAKDPQRKSEQLDFFLRTGAFSYGTLTLLLEKRSSNVAATYRARAEIFSDVIRGKLTLGQMEAREQENEAVKQRALDGQLAALEKGEPALDAKKAKSALEMGDRLGTMIAAHGKVYAVATSPFGKDKQKR